MRAPSTAHRLHWLTSEALRPRLFRFNDHGSAGEVDLRDLGNFDTRIAARSLLPASLLNSNPCSLA